MQMGHLISQTFDINVLRTKQLDERFDRNMGIAGKARPLVGSELIRSNHVLRIVNQNGVSAIKLVLQEAKGGDGQLGDGVPVGIWLHTRGIKRALLARRQAEPVHAFDGWDESTVDAEPTFADVATQRPTLGAILRSQTYPTEAGVEA